MVIIQELYRIIRMIELIGLFKIHIVPGTPSNISFPDVSTTTARMIWDAPIDPNGVILAYRITYALEGYSNPSFSMEFTPETRTFRLVNYNII
jgi:hypothetical protein